MSPSFDAEAARTLEERLHAAMVFQRGRMLEVVTALEEGSLMPSEARSYLGLVRDNLAAIRKAAQARAGIPAPGDLLLASLEYQRNRLLELLAGLRRGELTETHAQDYLEIASRNLAMLGKTARSLR